MTRVLQISANVSPLHGGPPEFALNLNRALRAHGHDARILTSDALLTDEDAAKLRSEFPKHALRMCSSRNRLREKVEWVRALRGYLRARPVVHLHGFYLWQTAVASLVCRWHGVPYLVHCHGIFEPYQAGRAKARKSFFNALVGRGALRRAAGLVFDTVPEQQVAELPRRVPTRPSYVIPPCPPTDASPPAPEVAPSGDGPRILFLARIAPKKRVDLAIAAMPEILREQPTARLHIAGEDSEGLVSEALGLLPPEHRESVVREGLVQGREKAALLAQSSLYVLPSENENFGISVAEALTAGLPVVISRAVGLAPDVERVGAGVVIDTLSASSVTDGVLYVLADAERYRRMRVAALALGPRLYSARATVDLAREAYLAAAGTGRG